MEEKTYYVCGSTDLDRFCKMRRIVFHYAHETPRYRKDILKNGKIYYGLSVLLTKAEQELVRRDISLINVPESCRVVL